MTRSFEAQVRRRTLHSINRETALVADMNGDVGRLQQWACGFGPAATPAQVWALARLFQITPPAGYGQTTGKVA
jgi:hypothetical protein